MEFIMINFHIIYYYLIIYHSCIFFIYFFSSMKKLNKYSISINLLRVSQNNKLIFLSLTQIVYFKVNENKNLIER